MSERMTMTAADLDAAVARFGGEMVSVLMQAETLRRRAERAEQDTRSAWMRVDEACAVIERLEARVAAMERVCRLATRLRHAYIGTQEAIDLRTELLTAVDDLEALGER